ncbi:MAG: NAD+ synthase [Deltaproteobacteria bacterium]|nr:NAD+ synthase [Deltaproteobacteria bacterium]
MKIGLVQINPVIGDFKNNCDKIIRWAERAKEKGCSLVIFPELAISGYPPQDLLERKIFLQAGELALQELLPALPPLDVMLGCVECREEGRGKPLYNSAVVIRKKKIIFRARKQLLPSYDVFDETRYFEPGPPSEIYELEGHRFCVTVCEDIWHHEIRDHELRPVKDFFAAAAEKEVTVDGVINISASPFQIKKEGVRRSIFKEICERYSTPFFYCNQVGGQDSLLFDGRSLAMDREGRIIAQAVGFEEDMVVVDTAAWKGEISGDIQPGPEAAVYDALVMGVRDYAAKCGFSSAVLGLSGGIDSALTAAIAADAFGSGNVLGVALPSPYSSADSLEDAEELALNLGCDFQVIPIADLFTGFKESLAPLFSKTDEDVTEQNLQARIRGNLLMALSNKFGHLLLSTGNKSEMAVGYCTLYGDMSGGLAVISDVPKQMVYELARYVNRDEVRIPLRTITKAPTAELKPDQRDQDDLPPYDILDQVLERHLENGEGVEEIVARGFEKTMVQDILQRVRLNEYKRKQAPMGLKVTTKAFGYGRRFPNVQNFQE